MTSDFLDDRRHALEEAFFAKQNQVLLRRLREADDTHSRRTALQAATGLTDPAVLDALLAQGLGPETVTAIVLVPAVTTAWADGGVGDRERVAILAIAGEQGLAAGSPGYGLIEEWLRTPPPPGLFAAWTAYASAIAAAMSVTERAAFRDDLLARARKVAGAAGGLFGGRVSVAEQAMLHRIEAALA